jgi:CubicO group peptidase (beta-lactamase class C family)
MWRRFIVGVCMALLAALAARVAPLAPVAADAQTPAASPAGDPQVANALSLVQVWIDAQRAYEQIPGASAAVVYDQQLLWSGGYGSADVAARRPATPDTVYSICSISKLFTSVAAMQLRDAGKLRLDDPVAKHLPWFTIKRMASDGPEITIEGLLTHASGLPREADYPYWSGDFTFPTHEQIVERVREQETLYPAERYFQYSNLGLTLVGEIVASESGLPYAAYVQQRILQPLGMSHTTPEMPEGERGKSLATGYSVMPRDGSRIPMPFFRARGIAPAAGYASTVGDLARFASWQFRLLERGGTEILNANTLREMQRPHFVDPEFETIYGLGFAVWRNDGKTFVGHGGSCPGFRTQLLLKPDEKIAAVFMVNALGVNAQQWTNRMYDIVAPAVKAAVKEPGKAKPAAPDLDRYLGSFESSFGGETAVVRWEGGLAVLDLPTMEPLKNLVKLKQVGEHRFRRVRKDDTLGEEFTFEMGPDNRPLRLKHFSNYSPLVKRTNKST